MVEMKIDKVEGIKSFSRLDFPLPPHFVFGSGTSSYQVEGAAFEDGRTPSIWDTHAHSGYTNGANGDIACDGHHKYKVMDPAYLQEVCRLVMGRIKSCKAGYRIFGKLVEPSK